MSDSQLNQPKPTSATALFSRLKNLENERIIRKKTIAFLVKKGEITENLTPSFELCLRKRCDRLTACYNLKTHIPLKKLTECSIFHQTRKVLNPTQTKATISNRNLLVILLGLDKILDVSDDASTIELFNTISNIASSGVRNFSLEPIQS
jgi:hypothetical protein